MTSEIVIMNKQAVSLAADSAVTITDGPDKKIFTTANKIFMLSRYRPVGIMIFDSAEFLGVPWETIIKEYRKKLGKKGFPNLVDYQKDFLKFLRAEESIIPDEDKKLFISEHIRVYLEFFVKSEIINFAQSKQKETGKIIESEVDAFALKLISSLSDELEKESFIELADLNILDNLIEKYGALVEKNIDEVFEKFPLSTELKKKLVKSVISYFIKNQFKFTGCSGLVFSGFGESEVYPTTVSIIVEGKIDNFLKFREYARSEVSVTHPGDIIPFAQQEPIRSFLEGIDPNYKNQVELLFSKIISEYPKAILESMSTLTPSQKSELEKKINQEQSPWMERFRKSMWDYSMENYVGTVLRIVHTAPKEELASMAETLVNLTSFKRKVSWQPETVGGPIDVAVISKGDGFVWIKRKHYFKPEYNQYYSLRTSIDDETVK